MKPKTEDFEFYLDQKVTMWERKRFTIPAKTKEEALKIVQEKFTNGDIHYCDDNADWEDLYDTKESMPIADNDGCATEELYDASNDQHLISNTTKP
jgi:hypothetical protein